MPQSADVLTTFPTGAGLLPLAMIDGLLVSTILPPVVVPAFRRVLMDRPNKDGDSWFQRLRRVLNFFSSIGRFGFFAPLSRQFGETPVNGVVQRRSSSRRPVRFSPHPVGQTQVARLDMVDLIDP